MNKKGFTLVELLAVIIILAIVALIATPIVLNVIEDSRKSAAESDANIIYNTINDYCKSNMLLGKDESIDDVDCSDPDNVIENLSSIVTTDAKVVELELNKAGTVTKLKVEKDGYSFVLKDNKMVYSNLITFIVTDSDGVDIELTAEEGMTWGEWAKSSYVHERFALSDDGLDVLVDGWGYINCGIDNGADGYSIDESSPIDQECEYTVF